MQQRHPHPQGISKRLTSGAPQDEMFLRQPPGISPDVQEQLREKDAVPSAILPFRIPSQALTASSTVLMGTAPPSVKRNIS